MSGTFSAGGLITGLDSNSLIQQLIQLDQQPQEELLEQQVSPEPLSQELDVKGVTVRPRDVFIAAVDPKLRQPDGRDLVALMVVVRGRRDGVARTVTYRLLDSYDVEHGISAMMRATAYSLSITGQMQVDGRIGPAGVRPAYLATPGGAYIDELRRRELAIDIQETLVELRLGDRLVFSARQATILSHFR